MGNYEHYQVCNNQCHYNGVTSTTISNDSTPCTVNMFTNNIQLKTTSKKHSPITFTPSGDFTEYIMTLDPWEQQLLMNVKTDENIFKTIELCNEDNATLYMTSDGSAPDFIRTFGWAARTNKGVNIATNNGPAPGHRTTSYRAEAYRLLSFILFLYHAITYTSSTPPEQVKLYSDSQSLVDTINKIMQWPHFYSTATLMPDWDVIQAIIRILKTFPTIPTLSHVPGHQDTKKAYNQLKLEAQLNINADKLAGIYQYPIKISQTKSPMIKGTVVQINHNNSTITSKLRRNVRRFATSQTTKQYISEKNNLHAHYDLIDWTIHGISVRKQYTNKHFFVKYIHNWLPLGDLVSKYAIHYPASCPSCDCIHETRHHMLRCPKRKEERSKLFVNLRRFFDYFPTDPFLKILLQRVLTQLLNDENLEIPPHEDKYSELIQSQSRTGWDQILLGRFVIEWKEIASFHIKTLPKKKQKRAVSGTSWVSNITELIFNFTQMVWIERNKDRHGRDSSEKEKILLNRAVIQTEELYKMRLDILPRHRKYFYDSFEEHLQEETTSRGLQQWVTTWGPVIRHSLSTAKNLGVTRMNSILQYFRPINTNSTT